MWLITDAVVVIAGVGVFAFIWWWAGARHYCTSHSMLFLIIDIGPRANTHTVDELTSPERPYKM
jgi:uncharacterized membrane protein YqiK